MKAALKSSSILKCPSCNNNLIIGLSGRILKCRCNISKAKRLLRKGNQSKLESYGVDHPLPERLTPTQTSKYTGVKGKLTRKYTSTHL